MIQTEKLEEIAKKLVTQPKGILAIDESMKTCDKRFEELGIPKTVEKRQAYRELLITTPNIEQYVSGFILFDETFWQTTKLGVSFVSTLKEKGIEPGIKVDNGTKDFSPDGIEKITEGLDGLALRLKQYFEAGATFAKWRSVITITETTPTEENLRANAKLLAEYASLCQEAGIVPIVEPEVLIDGSHSIERSYEVVSKTLDVLFDELNKKNVFLPGAILKTSMVISGKNAENRASIETVASETVKCLKEHVPANIGGIVFLSGGQTDEEAVLHLNAMHQLGDLPWPLTFSYGRAIQNPALLYFSKNPEDMAGGQERLLERAKANSDASIGKYKI